MTAATHTKLLVVLLVIFIDIRTNGKSNVSPIVSQNHLRDTSCLILSGDIEENPGPVKHPCLACEKPVAKSHRAIMCEICEKWIHIKCSNITPAEYLQLSGSDEPWFCIYCSVFSFSDSFFSEDFLNAPAFEKNIGHSSESQSCDRFENINDSYIPQPGPEEDWDAPQTYPESDPEDDHSVSSKSESDTSVYNSVHNSPDSDKYDVYDKLRTLKNENKKKTVICHLNINSIRYKFDELREILDDKLVDMLIISETKIDSSFNDNLFQVEGYKTERRDRTAHGGGLMTFVRSDLPFKRRKDLECEELETICYELAMAKRKWGIIGSYRQPSMTNQTFESDMTKCLDKMFIHYENLICIGDLNYDILRNDKCQPLNNICDNFSLDCIIKEPTCFTKHSDPSLFDVILTNSKTLLCKTVNFSCGLSDCHNMVATSLKESCSVTETKKVTFRSYKNFNEAELNEELSRVPFHVAHIFDDIDDIYWAHETLLRQVVNEHAPLKEKTPKPNSPPYMNSEYRKIIYQTREARKDFNKHKTAEKWKKYTKLRNKKTKVKRDSISVYFLERCGGGPKSKDVWPTIKPFLSQKQVNKSNSNIILKEDENLISDQKIVCDKLNSFYIIIAQNIGINSTTLVNTDHPSIKKMEENINVQTFKFQPVTEKQVITCIKKLDAKKTTGVDALPPKIIKAALPSLILPIRNIANEMQIKETFPSRLKMAQVTPVYKKDDPFIQKKLPPSEHASNYVKTL